MDLSEVQVVGCNIDVTHRSGRMEKVSPSPAYPKLCEIFPSLYLPFNIGFPPFDCQLMCLASGHGEYLQAYTLLRRWCALHLASGHERQITAQKPLQDECGP